MKMVLKSPNEAPYEPGKDFSVVIACADSAAAAPACEILELIEASLTDEGRLFYQWWNFEVLTVNSLRELAAVEAATADIIIIGLHEGHGLPREVTDWMKQWLGLRKNRHGALVALLDSDLKDTDASQEILAHLKQAATFGHMDFFTTRAKDERESGVARWASEAARQFGAARNNEAQSVLPCDRKTSATRFGSKKPSNQHRLFMNPKSQTPPVVAHDEVARLARQIWESEGCQSGKDQEYWLKAEAQLRATRQTRSTKPLAIPNKHKLSAVGEDKSSAHPSSAAEPKQQRLAGR